MNFCLRIESSKNLTKTGATFTTGRRTFKCYDENDNIYKVKKKGINQEEKKFDNLSQFERFFTSKLSYPA